MYTHSSRQVMTPSISSKLEIDVIVQFRFLKEQRHTQYTVMLGKPMSRREFRVNWPY